MNGISPSLIIMREAVIVAFIFCFVAVDCNTMLFPLESRHLNTACDTSEGFKGVYKLPSQCRHKKINFGGYIKSVGACVCCPTSENATAENATSYCKKFGADKPIQVDFHVLDGEDAAESEFPFMASIGYDNLGEINFDCGGSLIHSKFVLTAAHCCVKRQLQPKVVRLGRVRTFNSICASKN